MQIYHYDPTSLLLLAIGQADPSPLEEDVFLIPAHATDIAPPSFDPATHTCRFIDGGWAVAEIPQSEPEPEPSLADRQSAVWNKIKVERSARMSGGSKVDNKWFHTDQDSRLQHLGLKDSARDLLAAGAAMSDAITINGQQVAWKTMDGTFAPMTVQLAFDIVEADKALDAALFIAAETHRAQMMAADDPDAYNYSSGWPERFTA